jgi:hypothetical protein
MQSNRNLHVMADSSVAWIRRNVFMVRASRKRKKKKKKKKKSTYIHIGMSALQHRPTFAQ